MKTGYDNDSIFELMNIGSSFVLNIGNEVLLAYLAMMGLISGITSFQQYFAVSGILDQLIVGSSEDNRDHIAGFFAPGTLNILFLSFHLTIDIAVPQMNSILITILI